MLPAVEIILPCYRPNDKWYKELLSFYQAASPHFNLSFIVVNDGSGAGKVEEHIKIIKAQNITINLISYENNMGKGYALRKGVSASQSGHIVYTDIDFPFENFSTLAVLEKLVSGGADIVAGYRESSYYLNKMSGFRRILSRSFRLFMESVLKMPVSDTQCGLKGFNSKGREYFLATKINRYLFDFEFIYTATKSKLAISTVPVNLKENVVFSKMRFGILFHEFFNLLRVLLFRSK